MSYNCTLLEITILGALLHLALNLVFVMSVPLLCTYNQVLF